jgi:hypothetical protein
MKFKKHISEQVQPGNPHKLVRKQHVFPHASIKRFYGSNGTVNVAFTHENRIVHRLHGNHDLFCANRVWDQRAESGYMAQIEREFQFLAERILQNDLTWWALGHTVIAAFYALWHQRAHYAANPIPPAELKAVSPGRGLTMDEKERLESHHALYVDEACRIPSRQMTGMRIQRAIDSTLHQLRDVKWFVCRAAAGTGEFLVPDRPSTLHIPLSPTVTLLGNMELPYADAATIRLLNLTSIAGSRRFAFARDLANCFPR